MRWRQKSEDDVCACVLLGCRLLAALLGQRPGSVRQDGTSARRKCNTFRTVRRRSKKLKKIMCVREKRPS
jgi:hypothetical protein